MTIRKPLVLINGRVQELPLTDVTRDEDMNYAKQVDFASDTVIYKGEAAIGSSTASAVWRVHKLTLAGDGDMAEIWADGNADFDNIWDNRASLSYS